MREGEGVPFSDLTRQWRPIRNAVRSELDQLFEASSFCLGPWVERFEADMAAYLGVRQAVGVNSGSSALHIAMIAAGVAAGDKVLLPAQTFVGTIWGVLYQGAIPILCDVDPRTATLHPEEIERRWEPGVKAVIPVHLFGQPADMAKISQISDRYGITVVEDVAQAVAARFDGLRLGSIGRLGCFSFYPGKNLGAAGEAGMVATNDDELASRLRALRNHGQNERYVHDEVGYNYRMDGIQALVLRQKLPFLDTWTRERQAIAQRYSAEFADLPLELPEVVHGDHVFHLYVVRTADRDRLQEHLRQHRVATGLHYPIPLHRQPCLTRFQFDQNGFPAADAWAREGLTLPLFTGMTESEVEGVVSSVRSFFGPTWC
jgi:dTDP-4-amino-4,6-dideoxygalactose transaminase